MTYFRHDVMMNGMQRQYIITNEESFVIAGVCEYNECNYECLSKKHNINNFKLYVSSRIFSAAADINSILAELLPRFVGVYDDVKQEPETYTLSYQSNDKTTITNIINEFKYFFGVN